MGLDHVPVVMHFGPNNREPIKLENNNLVDPFHLLNFITSQSGARINFEEALKPEKSYVLHILVASLVFGLLGLVYFGKVPASLIFQNDYIWSALILVSFNLAAIQVNLIYCF